MAGQMSDHASGVRRDASCNCSANCASVAAAWAHSGEQTGLFRVRFGRALSLVL